MTWQALFDRAEEGAITEAEVRSALERLREAPDEGGGDRVKEEETD